MRALAAWVVVVVSLASAAPMGHVGPQADGIADLLTRLERAMTANDVAAFRALVSPRLPELDQFLFELTLFGDDVTAATIRERDRESVAGGSRVLAEMLVERHGAGRIATWQIVTAAVNGATRIVGLRQVSAIGGLHRLALDTSTAFAVHRLTFTATDVQITMPEGVAFQIRTAEGVTGLVLRGPGEVRFEPPDPTERHQVQRFAKAPAIIDRIDSAFVRIHPGDFDDRISAGSLTPIPVTEADLSRAKGIFNQWARQSYNVKLGDLSDGLWSLLPGDGDALADVRTRRWGWLSYARSGGLNEDVSFFDRANRKNISVYASAAKLATRGRFYSEDDNRAYDVEHYEMNVRFAPEKREVGGTVTMRVRLLKHDMETLTLKLAEPLTISSLTAAGMGRLLFLRVVGQDSLLVSFPSALPINSVVSLSFAYQGVLAPQSLSRESATVTADGPQDPANDAVPAEPNWAYSNNAFWYPQAEVNDYATARIRVTVPQEYTAVATGTRIDEGLVGTDRVAAFVADTPARYLSTIISRLVPLPRSETRLPGGRSIAVDALSNPRQLGNTRTLAARSADMIAFYAGLAGGAPYPSFTLLSLEADLPGGHSPAYFAAINQPSPQSQVSWRHDPIAFDDRFPDVFLAHEVAHQWWGQGVGVKNYHEQWLSEGLAQYFAWRYAGQVRGPELQRALLDRMKTSVRRYNDSGPIAMGYRLGHVVGDGSNFRAIVYNKSVVVLDLLGRLIGQDVFDRGLRRFYQEMQFRKAGADDLRRAMEAESGQPLARFFDRWVYESALPQLSLSAVVETSGDAALVRIVQTGPVFDLPVTLTIAYADGPAGSVTLPIHDAVTERRIPLTGRVKAGGIRLVPVL